MFQGFNQGGQRAIGSIINFYLFIYLFIIIIFFTVLKRRFNPPIQQPL